MIHVSVIIVSYRVKYLLQQCIQSVIEASKNIKSEIIVVDNQSNDGTCEYIKEKFCGVRFIENKENAGFSKANNQGVAIASGAYVLILNPDTVIAEDTLEKLLAFAGNKKKIGIVGAKLVDGTGNFLPESKRGIPSPWVSFNKLFGLFKSQSNRYYASHLGEDETGRVEILVGAFMFMKRVLYKEVGGFDEAYFMYGEDIDLSYKVLKKGYQNYYLAKTQVIHYKGESTQKSLKYLNHFLHAMKIFYKKHFKVNSMHNLLLDVGSWSWYFSKYLKMIYQSHENQITTSKKLLLSTNRLLLKKLNFAAATLETNIEISPVELLKIIKNQKIEEVIFDNDGISNKEIIKHIQFLKNKLVIYKIKPKNANFTVASSGSRFKCEVNLLE